MKVRPISLVIVGVMAFGCAKNASALTPQDILNGFPLCSILSSRGPYCRSLSEEQQTSYVPKSISSDARMELTENSIEIETENWFYSFEINKTTNGYVVSFTDDALKGTYLSLTDYFIEKNVVAGRWQITGEMQRYLSGNSDSNDLNAYMPYEMSIPFYVERE